MERPYRLLDLPAQSHRAARPDHHQACVPEKLLDRRLPIGVANINARRSDLRETFPRTANREEWPDLRQHLREMFLFGQASLHSSATLVVFEGAQVKDRRSIGRLHALDRDRANLAPPRLECGPRAKSVGRVQQGEEHDEAGHRNVEPFVGQKIAGECHDSPEPARDGQDRGLAFRAGNPRVRGRPVGGVSGFRRLAHGDT
jgi:hypothetical protein